MCGWRSGSGCRLLLAAGVLLLAAPGITAAQPDSGFTPVTDAMLQAPARTTG